MMRIRVLVVDDSTLMRALLTQMIELAPDIEVVGSAPDAATAREMIKALNPDVLTLDVNMPGMDGLAFLEKLMRLRQGNAVKVASTQIALPRSVPPAARGTAVGKVIFIGASTGGTEALKTVLQGMPADCPPILVVQHMPETFTGSFARRLDSLCPPKVIEAQGNERIETGTVYIAPGHSHLKIRRSSGLMTELTQTALVNRHRPAVDVLFESAAEVMGNKALGMILTGMGKDGAQGLLKMRDAGARTFGQNEASCVVYGMPREAFEIDAVEEQASLEELCKRILTKA